MNAIRNMDREMTDLSDEELKCNEMVSWCDTYASLIAQNLFTASETRSQGSRIQLPHPNRTLSDTARGKERRKYTFD